MEYLCLVVLYFPFWFLALPKTYWVKKIKLKFSSYLPFVKLGINLLQRYFELFCSASFLVSFFSCSLLYMSTSEYCHFTSY